MHIVISFFGAATDNVNYRYDNRTALSLFVQEMSDVIFKLSFEPIQIYSLEALADRSAQFVTESVH